MLVQMNNDDCLDMLMERLEFWTDDEDTHELYRQYYEEMIDCGAFDGSEFDVMCIVDNDYVNWLNVISKDEFEDYNIENEDDDCILAKYNDWYLIRA